MSRKVQIRRGTAAQHETFIGAEGEITMDTTNKTLRVHDGTTTGGIELAKQSDIPAPVITAIQKQQNGYVKFANGLIIQWGVVKTETATGTTTYPTSFSAIPVVTTSNFKNSAATQIGVEPGTGSFSWTKNLAGSWFRWIAIGY